MAKVILVCGNPKCCPELVVKEDDGTIRDLTDNDVKILKEKIKRGEL